MVKFPVFYSASTGKEYLVKGKFYLFGRVDFLETTFSNQEDSFNLVNTYRSGLVFDLD